MDAGATWVAFGMAALSLFGTTYAARNARLANRDKAEVERAAARDKMEFDLRMREIDLKQKGSDERMTKAEASLATCQEQHKECQERHDITEANLTAAQKQQLVLTAEVADMRRRLSTVVQIEGR